MNLNSVIGRYAVLLTAALLLFVLEPVLTRTRDIPWGLSAVSFLLILGSLRAVWEDHRFFRVVAVLGTVFWLSEVGEPFFGGDLPIFTDVSALAFIGATLGGILFDIFTRKTVSADAVFGAAAVYLLIGLWFARAFMMVAHFEPSAFAVSDPLLAQAADEDFRGTGVLHYFSLITLTTVGYGDVAPVAPVARNLAAVEAVIAQLYIAAVIARLVAIHSAGAGTSNDES